jgi:hypothetical protein
MHSVCGIWSYKHVHLHGREESFVTKFEKKQLRSIKIDGLTIYVVEYNHASTGKIDYESTRSLEASS